MSREKRAKKSVGSMNGWENCDVPAENPTVLSSPLLSSPLLSTPLHSSRLALSFSLRPRSLSFCRFLDDGQVPTILLHLVSEPSRAESSGPGPGPGPESSSLRCRGQILRLLSARKK